MARKKKRAIALAGGGPAAGLHIGALAALEDAGIEFDVFALSCIGAWVGLVYNTRTGDNKAQQTFQFFDDNCFRADDSYAWFPINRGFGTDVPALLSAWAKFPFLPDLQWSKLFSPQEMQASLRKSWSISAGWESRLGETQLDYSQDRRIGLSAALGSREESTFQLSHMVRWHGWRAGIDGTVTRSTSSKTSGYGATSYSAGSTLAYQVTDGPEFTLQLGRDHDRMTLNDRSYLSANDGTRLTASLDLTAWLNHRFARKDLRFRFEFRKLLEAQQEERLDPEQQLFDRLYDRRDRDVVQVSFGMVF